MTRRPAHLPQSKYNFMATDQYGNRFMIERHPRKELCEQLGSTHAKKMYTELKDGTSFHSGYVIAGHWLRVVGLEGNIFSG